MPNTSIMPWIPKILHTLRCENKQIKHQWHSMDSPSDLHMWKISTFSPYSSYSCENQVKVTRFSKLTTTSSQYNCMLIHEYYLSKTYSTIWINPGQPPYQMKNSPTLYKMTLRSGIYDANLQLHINLCQLVHPLCQMESKFLQDTCSNTNINNLTYSIQ